MSYFTKKTSKSTPIHIVDAGTFSKWLKKQDKTIKDWVKSSDFKGKPGETLLVPSAKNGIHSVIRTIGDDLLNMYALSSLPTQLPPSNSYYISGRLKKEDAINFSIGWGLGCYEFTKYKSGKGAEFAKLVLPDNADKKLVKDTIDAVFMVRNLINTPANDMGPEELASEARKLAKKHQATTKVIVGNELLKQNFPAIHAVGRAAPQKPRLIDIRWGNKKNPKITLVGKGVCYDTGGLSLKPTAYMVNMKKDMGGAAHVLGLASMIMAQKLPIHLRVLIPAVENSVSSDSYRPGDVIKTRKGLSVEVGNTDAEGRIVLADALALASKDDPDLIIDFATLTGSARIALGPDLPAMFSNNDRAAQDLLNAAKKAQDPLWNMPLWQPYKPMLNSKTADTNNVAGGSFAGSIIAALFLEKFVEPKDPWIHIDTFGWNPVAKPGRPDGGEALGMRAVFEMIASTFGKKKK